MPQHFISPDRKKAINGYGEIFTIGDIVELEKQEGTMKISLFIIVEDKVEAVLRVVNSQEDTVQHSIDAITSVWTSESIIEEMT